MMSSWYLRAALFATLFLCSITVEAGLPEQIQEIKGRRSSQETSRQLRKSPVYIEASASASESQDVSSSSDCEETDKSSKFEENKSSKTSKGEIKEKKNKGSDKSKVYKESKETSESDDDSTKEESTKTKDTKSKVNKDSKGKRISDDDLNAEEEADSDPSPVGSGSTPSEQTPVSEPQMKPTGTSQTSPTAGTTTASEIADDLQPVQSANDPSNAPTNALKPTTATETEDGTGMAPVPSLSPGPSTTPVPISEKACQVGSNGSLGTTTTRGQEVIYFYQVETTASATQRTVNKALLPQLETALNSRLLAFHFDDCLGQVVTLREETDTPCRAQGYSEFPTDRVLRGVSCVESRVDPSNNCFVVVAGASLHFGSESDCSDAVKSSKEEIRVAMNSGAFNDVDDRIVKLTYVKESDLEFSPPNTVEGSNNGGGETEPVLHVYVWVLIGLGGVLSLLVVALAVKHRRRPGTNDDDIQVNPIDDVDIVREPSIVDNAWYDKTQTIDKSREPVTRDNDDTLLPKMESQDEDAREGSEDRELDIDSNAPPPDEEATPESGEDSFEGEESSGQDTDEQSEGEAANVQTVID